jgi:hypothetical protein
MKNVILSTLAMASIMVSCNQKNNEQVTVEPVVTKSKTNLFTDTIVSDYLKLKNALTEDNTEGAATAGKSLFATFKTVNLNTLDDKQKKEYLDIADDATEHAEHIGSNSGNIEHQREHFATLSTDINDLVKTFGTTQKLYQDFCPMYNNDKGAIWISETQEIKNPYYGVAMLSCGSTEKEL